MNSNHLMLAMVLAVSVLAAACAGPRQQQQHLQQQQVSDVSTAWPLDSMNYLFSDLSATSPVNDHPLRWVGFLGHSIGTLADFVINRPIYALASGVPFVTGYTPEDATLNAQRRSGYR